MTTRAASMRRVRRQKTRTLTGFIVTWDVDSRDSRTCALLRRFVFGQTVVIRGKTYRYPGLVDLEGVQYLGQSVLFVVPGRLDGFADSFDRTESTSQSAQDPSDRFSLVE